MSDLFPLVSLREITLAEANSALVTWGHKMGPLRRPINDETAHGLFHEGAIVAVTTTSGIIRETVAGLPHVNRENSVELSRLCAARPSLNRVMLRLWREFVFPRTGRHYAVSYQDADVHTGNTYRFDGWTRAAYSRAGGADRRSGRRPRNKWVWIWEART